MLFNSIEFLFIFLPITFFVYFFLNKKRLVNLATGWLVIASLYFYAYWKLEYLPIILCSMVFNYTIGTTLSKADNLKINKKALMIFGVVVNLGALFYYKYFDFVIYNLNKVFHGDFNYMHIVLPLAISFFTFQQIAYLVDSYKGETKEYDFLTYALFVTFFPQLIAGPIVHHKEMMPQFAKLKNRIINPKNISIGLFLIAIGLAKKVLLADFFSPFVQQTFDVIPHLTCFEAWCAAISYTFQLYFDFSGYSDMAIGLGKMFGFQFTENFDFPYASANLSEFWRRWHISLGSWFRDYLYIPLGGSRVSSKIRIALNLLIVWLATGIWHGTDFTFILWGILHGILIVFEKITGLPEKIKNKTFLQILYRGFTLFIVIFGWMLFRSEDMVQAMDYIRSLFKLNGNPWRGDMFIFNFREYYFTLIFAFISAFPIIRYIRSSISKKGKLSENTVNVVWYCIQLLLAVISLSCLAMNTHNPFLYSNF